MASWNTLVAEWSDVWFVIPVYNEAPVIADVVEDALRDVPERRLRRRRQPRRFRRAARQGRRARWCATRSTSGQGAALQTGIEYALRRPGCAVLRHLRRRRPAPGRRTRSPWSSRLRGGDVDIVFGSRFLDGAPSPCRGQARCCSRPPCAQPEHDDGLSLTDAHNGLRALNRTVAEQLDITHERHGARLGDRRAIAEAKFRYTELPVTSSTRTTRRQGAVAAERGEHRLRDVLQVRADG